MMIEAFFEGLLSLFSAQVMISMFLGALYGIILGIAPVLGGMTGVALTFPFLYYVSPEVGLIFIVAVMAVGPTGGAITTILLGIPGDIANAATLIDGYPMAKKGEGARALGAALVSSAAGGIIGLPIALLMMPIIIPLIKVFKSGEMFFLILLGLSFIAVLAGKSKLKGVIAGLAGIILSFVGMHPTTGTPRFAFETVYLLNGFNVAIFGMGLFGLAELFDYFLKGKTSVVVGEVKPVTTHDLWLGAKDVLRHWALFVRCSIIGYIIGFIPGLGPTAAVFMSYGHAKQTSKRPEEFGTGCVEGVIAPEAANNSKMEGGLLTTLAFGIPGTPIMALLMGAFYMVGITPGTEMLREQLPLSFALLLSVAAVNLIGVLQCFPFIPLLVKIVTVPYKYILSILLVVIFVASFLIAETMLDVLAVVLFGILGFFMVRFGYSRICLILGFVLGDLFEFHFLLAYKFHGPLFFLTPISLGIIIIIATIYTYSPLKQFIVRRRQRSQI